MYKIAITSRKGGTGKTTTAQNVGAALVRRGYSVLYVDLDNQANLSFIMRAAADGISSYEVMTGKATAEQAIQRQSLISGIIPASGALALLDRTTTGKDKVMHLKAALGAIDGKYDFALLDCPPSLGLAALGALAAADGVLVPLTADMFSLQSIGALAETFDTVKAINDRLKVLGIVLTRHNSRLVLSAELEKLINAAAARLETQVFDTKIRECTALREAAAARLDIFTYAGKSNAAQDYGTLTDELLQGAGIK